MSWFLNKRTPIEVEPLESNEHFKDTGNKAYSNVVQIDNVTFRRSQNEMFSVEVLKRGDIIKNSECGENFLSVLLLCKLLL